MVDFKILDTGYVTTSIAKGSQTQLGSSARAGYNGTGVSPITFKLETHSFNSTANLENKPVIGTISDSESNLVSVENRTIDCTGVIKKEITTTGYNVNNIIEFERLNKTHGLKIFYPTAADSYLPTIIEALGHENKTDGFFSAASFSDQTGTVSPSITYIIGRIKNISIRDGNDSNYWRVSFTFIMSG